MLVEPFNKPPKTMDNKWDDFYKTYTLQDVKHSVLQQNSLELTIPQYKIDITRDLMEYVAFQEIPNFGSHFYYAFSLEQLPHWQNFSKFKVPSKLIPTLLTTNIPAQDDDEITTTSETMAETPASVESVESVESVPGHVRFNTQSSSGNQEINDDDGFIEERVNETMKRIREASQRSFDTARNEELKLKIASIKNIKQQPILIPDFEIEQVDVEEIEVYQLPPEFLDASDRIRSVARMTTSEMERLNRNETPNLTTTDVIVTATDQVGHVFLDAFQSTDKIDIQNTAVSVVDILDATIDHRNLVQIVSSPNRVVNPDITRRLQEIKEQIERDSQNSSQDNKESLLVSNIPINEQKKSHKNIEFDFDSVDNSVGIRTTSQWIKMRIAEKIEMFDDINLKLETLSDDILENIQEAIVNCEFADEQLQQLVLEEEVTPFMQNNAETSKALMHVAIDINSMLSENRASLPEEVAEASNEAILILRENLDKTANLANAIETSDETKSIEEIKSQQFELIVQDLSYNISDMANSIPSASVRAEIMDISNDADNNQETNISNKSNKILEQVNEAIEVCRQEQESLESSNREDETAQYLTILSDNNSATIENLEEVQNILHNNLSD
ncbi:unnamed protein product [Diamesa serratosioi]